MPWLKNLSKVVFTYKKEFVVVVVGLKSPHRIGMGNTLARRKYIVNHVQVRHALEYIGCIFRL